MMIAPPYSIPYKPLLNIYENLANAIILCYKLLISKLLYLYPNIYAPTAVKNNF